MADFSALKTSIQNYIKQNGNEEITGNLLQQILLSMVSTLGDSAINDLVTALSSEVIARQNADGTLQININNEATARGNADTQLGNRITSEAETREGADNTLRGLIDGIIDDIENGYVYAGIANPSTTPASGKVFYIALTAGEYTNFGAAVVPQGINILKYNGSAWSVDVVIAIDDQPTDGSGNLVKSGGVYSKINQEKNRAVGAENTLQQNITAEKNTLQQNITAEKNRAKAAEDNLHQEIQSEEDERKQEIQDVRDDVFSLIHDYKPIVIKGDVVNAPDEEDITQQPNNLLKFKDKAYNPTIFSGLGRKYLRKNVVINEDYVTFDGFLENPECDDMLVGVPDAILWARLPERFVAQKDDAYYLDWEGSGDYIPVSADKIYVNNNIPYTWNGEDLIVDDNLIERYGNRLTQEMINQPNTIYVIQYDFVLDGDITIPDNCILEFAGGSVSGEHTLTGANTGIQAGLVKIFNTNVTLGGTWKVAVFYNVWFGVKPNDSSTNYDIEWGAFISAIKGRAEGCIVEGEYELYSQLNLTGTTSIIGSNRKPRIIFKGQSNESAFFVTGGKNSIKNLFIERVEGSKHSATAITLGDLNTNREAIYGQFEHITCKGFEVGINFNFCWNNSCIDLDLIYNYYGILFHETECYINHLNCEANIVGVYIKRGTSPVENYSDPIIGIYLGTIEQNGIGCVFESGWVSLKGVYMEFNYPNETNGAGSVEWISENYPQGANVICGNSDTYWVDSLDIDDCYVGHADGKFSSLFEINKCNNLSIKGTLIKNLVTTENTRINDRSVYVNHRRLDENNPNIHLWQLAGLSDRVYTDSPCLYKNFFESTDMDTLNRVVIGSGIGLYANPEPSGSAYTPDNISILNGIITVSSGDNPNISHGFIIVIVANSFENGIYTIVTKLKVKNTTKYIESYSSYDGRKKYLFKEYANRNEVLYLPIKIDYTGVEQTLTVGVNPNSSLELSGIYLYKGNIYGSATANDFGKILNTDDIHLSKKALLIPNVAPSTRAFDIKGSLEAFPRLYFDETTKKLKVVSNNATYDNVDGVSESIPRYGDYDHRPSKSVVPNGFQYFNTDTNKIMIKSVDKWYYPDGTEATE